MLRIVETNPLSLVGVRLGGFSFMAHSFRDSIERFLQTLWLRLSGLPTPPHLGRD
jgi:hypothetical protein